MGNELRATVHSQMGGYRITHQQLLDRVNNINSLAATAHPNRQANPALLIHHVQELERAAIHRLVELNVECLHVVRVFSPEQRPGAAAGRKRFRRRGRGR